MLSETLETSYTALILKITAKCKFLCSIQLWLLVTHHCIFRVSEAASPVLIVLLYPNRTALEAINSEYIQLNFTTSRVGSFLRVTEAQI